MEARYHHALYLNRKTAKWAKKKRGHANKQHYLHNQEVQVHKRAHNEDTVCIVSWFSVLLSKLAKVVKIEDTFLEKSAKKSRSSSMRRSKAPSSLAKSAGVTTGTVNKPFSLPVKREPLAPLPKGLDTVKPKTEDEVEAEMDTTEENGQPNNNHVEQQPMRVIKPAIVASSTGPKFKTPFKSPTTATSMAIVKAKQSQEQSEKDKESEPDLYYTVMWCNYSTKKHKSYNDGMNMTTNKTILIKYRLQQKLTQQCQQTQTNFMQHTPIHEQLYSSKRHPRNHAQPRTSTPTTQPHVNHYTQSCLTMIYTQVYLE